MKAVILTSYSLPVTSMILSPCLKTHLTKLFNSDDPFAEQRDLNDKEYALDHFYTKLLKLPDTMNTGEGKRLAKKRSEFLLSYIDNLRQELGLSVSFCDE